MVMIEEGDRNNFSDELKEAKKAARLAGEKILRLYKENNKDFSIKNDGSELTSADLASNEILIKELMQKFPYKVISEEGEDCTIGEECVWVIDPLDGTKNFISKDGEFSVLISLFKNSLPYLGIVYLPAFDKMYFAQRGMGAYLEEGGAIRKINVSPLDKAYRAIISKNHYTKKDKEFTDFLGISNPIQKGSIGVKICEIAEGNADLYCNFDGSNKWDICAPQIVLEEAGGKVLDLSRKPLDYKVKDKRFRNGIIAISKDENGFFEKLNSFLKVGPKIKEGKLIWITGLAGAGKTLVAEEVYKKIKEKYPNTIHLDGDNVRKVLGEDKVHDLASRKRTAEIYSRLGSLLTGQGVNTIISTISLFHSIHELNRANNNHYIEVLLEANEDILAQRKPHIYAKRDIVGREHIPEFPKAPHLILKNESSEHLYENVNKILETTGFNELVENKKDINKPLKPKAADYTGVGENYRNYRSGYSEKILDLLLAHLKLQKDALVVDIGAGTGIWTKQIADRGIKCIAIEPNDDMVKNGLIYTAGIKNIEWKKGSGEQTNLPDNCADWVTMASSFHWTDHTKSLPEFSRILKKGSHITLLWNPLVREGDEIQEKVEAIIQKHIPGFSRSFRSGENSSELILGSRLFEEVIETKHVHYAVVPKEKYIMAWRAANHLRTEAEKTGPGVFDKIIADIELLLKDKEILQVPYFTKAWTAKKR